MTKKIPVLNSITLDSILMSMYRINEVGASIIFSKQLNLFTKL